MSEAPPTAPGAPGPAPTTLRLEQHGRAGELFPIVLVNVLLTLVTLTVYRFWAKTRVRVYLWSSTSLLGDRFEYTGRGMELFLGFLIVVAVVLLPLGLLGALAQFLMAGNMYGPAIALAMPLYLGVFYLTGVAVYRAQRYRLSRTRWRAIRPALTGGGWLYGLVYIAIMFLNGATFGWAKPWGTLRLTQQMLGNTYFGDRPFRFEGPAGPLYGRFAFYWVGSFFTVLVGIGLIVAIAFTTSTGDLETASEAEQIAVVVLSAAVVLAGFLLIGVLYAFYKARELAYLAECTTLEGLRFRFDATAGSLVGLVLGNLAILLLTLGLGLPFVQLRNFRYLAARLSAEGAIDFDAIAQSAEEMPSVGEGLADAFDVGSV